MTPAAIAANLLAQGLAVVPVRGKVPFDVTTGAPLKDWQLRRYTESELASVFASPVTGAGAILAASALADVDCDVPEAVTAAGVILRPTATFGRPSNPKSHWVFAVADPIPSKKFQVPPIPELRFSGGGKTATLVELRCIGSQTVWPGSHWIDPDDAAHVELIAWENGDQPTTIDGAELRLATERVAVATLFARCWPDPGARHNFTLMVSGWLLRADVPEDVVIQLIQAAALAASDEEWRARVANVRTTAERLRRGETVAGGGQLRAFIPPVVFDRVRDWLHLEDRPQREPGTPITDSPVDEPTESTAPQRFRLLSGDDILNIPPPSWLLGHLLQQDSLAVLYGAPGTGKSFVGLDMALFLAAEAADWHGLAIQGGPVVYVAAEGVAGIGIRCRAWCQHHCRDLPPDFYLVAEAPDFYDGTTDLEAVQEAIAAKLGDRQPVLIVIDTLARVMPGGEENSNRDMGLVISRCDALRRRFGCTIVLVHHTTKADAERERGATALRGAADTMLLVLADAGVISLTVDKQKNAASTNSMNFELHSVELEGIDGGSCVLMPGRVQAKGRDAPHAETAFHILAVQFEGRASWTRWRNAFMAVTNKKDSTFYRAHLALRQQGRVCQDGKQWVVVDPGNS